MLYSMIYYRMMVDGDILHNSELVPFKASASASATMFASRQKWFVFFVRIESLEKLKGTIRFEKDRTTTARALPYSKAAQLRCSSDVNKNCWNMFDKIRRKGVFSGW